MQRLHRRGHLCGCKALNADSVRSGPCTRMEFRLGAAAASQLTLVGWDAWNTYKHKPPWADDLSWAHTGALRFGWFWKQGSDLPPLSQNWNSPISKVHVSCWLESFSTFYRKQTVRLFSYLFYAPRIYFADFEIKIQLSFNTFSCCLIFELLHVSHPHSTTFSIKVVLNPHCIKYFPL